MIESIYKYMKIGIIHFMSYPEAGSGEGDICSTFKKIAEDDYFNAVEVTWVKNQDEKEKFKKLLKTSCLDITYVAHPRLFSTGLNINDTDKTRRMKALETLKEGIDEAYEYGAKGFCFVSGNYKEETKESSFKALVKSTKELCKYAKSKGDMKVVLEIFDYDIDKKSLIGPTQLAKRFAKEITSEYENFGLLVDLSHIPVIRESIKESIIPIKDYIVQAHIGNAVMKDPSYAAYGDKHPRFGFPNSENGIDELVEFLSTLKEAGFLNKDNPPVVSFEVKPWQDEDPDVVIASSKRYLNEAWAKL